MMETLFVPKDYVMDPVYDDLLFDGTEIKEGMVILLADSLHRPDPTDTINRWNHTRMLEGARWCTVLRVEITPRYAEDENGRVISSSPLLQFLAEYPDGTKAKRTYCCSFAWYVKKFSIPQDEPSARAD